ncbi:MAG: hypothetical protein EA387_04180 [Nitriliruptor sp.]|nr:MAG: hypothetical protein EA387_04180 [Nitriliruptor sp.]
MAQVAESVWPGWRLIGHRTRIGNDPDLPTVLAGWLHHAFITNRTGDAVTLDRDHRAHAAVELAIRDLQHDAGSNHCPPGKLDANAAWLLAATLVHKLPRRGPASTSPTHRALTRNSMTSTAVHTHTTSPTQDQLTTQRSSPALAPEPTSCPYVALR